MAKLAIITGASRGIGYSIAEKFLQNNYHVINISRKKCPLKVENFPCDLGNFKALKKTATEIAKKIEGYTKISLIHNAAISRSDNYSNTSHEDMEKILNINVLAPQVINNILIDKLPKNSSVIFIGSTLSEKAVPNSLSYITSKHAQAGMMKSLAQDLFGKQITTCMICPGFTDTEMLNEIFDKKSLKKVTTNKVSFQRLIKPEEIANLVYFCAENQVINGAIIHANLGQAEN